MRNKNKKGRVIILPRAPNACLMSSPSCPPPGLHRGLHPSYKTCRQLVPSDPRLGYALEGTEAVPFLIEDYCNLLYNVLEEELAELKLGNIRM
jgi:hypothetical protein